MPKQNLVKNLFKGSSSQAQSQSQASSPSFGRVSLHPPQSTQPIQPNFPTSSFVGGSSSSVGGSSQHVAPSSSLDGISSQPTKRRKVRGVEVHGGNWHVQLIDEDEEVTKNARLKTRDVFNLENGWRIIVDFNEYGSAIGISAGLLAQVLGHLATNSRYFPIGFEKWPHMPKAFIDRVFTEILLPRFFFRIDQERAKSHVDSSLNNKWKEFRLKLWRAAWDPLKSKEEIIRKVPTGIPMDQWALFANYRLKEETQVL
ncbi:uncharacterized protein LOC132054489 [Lycium ferocissimum]|uniref:uncharacterized protein LOC132054489 n=1 Tax=Lycium ferocissimum TaxID=112874 RepID=UPI002814B8AC|nr:uncharacterized protein LOC132054489 [Lycium ferocissimum]